MQRRQVLFLAAGGVAVLLLGLTLLLRAWKFEPSFYQTALRLPEPQARQLSDKLLERLGAISGSVQRTGPWNALVSGDEVNGWLATDFAENLADALPPGMSEPRVQIDRDRVRLGCRYGRGWSATVVHLEVEPFQASKEAVGLRIHAVRAGALPAPLGSLLEGITQAAHNAGWGLAWEQSGACPTAILRTDLRRRDGACQRIEAISLVDGKLYLAGCTERTGKGAAGSDTASTREKHDSTNVASQDAHSDARQR